MPNNTSDELVQAVVLTVIDDLELPTLLRQFDARCNTRRPKSVRGTYHYVLPRVNGKQLEVKVRCIGQAGNQFSGMETIDMLHRFEPRFIFLYGIAGALPRGDVSLGDVVVARQVDTLCFDKVTDTADEPKFHQKEVIVQVTHGIQDYIRDFLIDYNLPSRKDREYERAIKLNTRLPRVHHGVLFSWDLVLSSSIYCKELLARNRHRIAVEMELAGFYGAIGYFQQQCERYNKRDARVDGLVVRGLSDYANNKEKSDADSSVDWRSIAAENAAVVLLDVMQGIEDQNFE